MSKPEIDRRKFLLGAGAVAAAAAVPAVAVAEAVAAIEEPVVLDLAGGDMIFTYQWLRNGVPIPGAIGTAYTLTQEDLNADISIQWSEAGEPVADLTTA